MRKSLIAAAIIVISLKLGTPPPVYSFNARELKCLTDNVYYEARGEPILGQVLVARVTLNRTTTDVCETVYKHKQFSWTAKPYKITDKKAYNTARSAALQAYNFDNPALYFHNKTVKPSWALTKTQVAQVGNHTFYK